MGSQSPVFGQHPVVLLAAAVAVVLFCMATPAKAEDRYLYYTWVVSYGNVTPMGVQQQGILINGHFPGPQLDVITNDNILINVFNNLDEPFLLTWHGIKQRKNSWQDGVLGTNCPIPPKSNYTYKLQAKDQIGTYTYFPSTALHRAAGGYGALNAGQRSVIGIPYPAPTGQKSYTVLVSDWYLKAGYNVHQALRKVLDVDGVLPSPDGLLINGQPKYKTFSGDAGKTYMFHLSNVGLSTSINFRIQGHRMTVVEVEGSHCLQNTYDALDIHPGQSFGVIVAFNQTPKDYYIVASSRFTGGKVLTATAVLHYTNYSTAVSGLLPPGPATNDMQWSLSQARSFRLNLTANAARPNPQGSFHYGQIPIARTFVFENHAATIGGKHRYAVNGVSFVVPRVPLKLADYFGISGVIDWDGIPFTPPAVARDRLGTPAVRLNLHDFMEIVFQNGQPSTQTWHLDGYSFWVVGYGTGQWTPGARNNYNLIDAISRYTVQVYPNGWTAILVSLDNQGMWNLRSTEWAKQYLGQQLYLRVWTQEKSLANEYDIPTNALRC